MTPTKSFLAGILLAGLAAPGAFAQTVEQVEVVSRPVERLLRLPGELFPFQGVGLHARVTGFVDRVEVDRGSVVKKGDLLILLSAPEMGAQIATESQRIEAEAKLLAAQSTYERLKTAAETPGAVAGNEVIIAEKSVEAARALVGALESSAKAARSSVDSLRELQNYLKVTAPFDGVITERLVHPGALVGPESDFGPLLRLEQIDRLRLVVDVPETDVAAIPARARVAFKVPAHPESTFQGTVARISHSVDPKTRTMPIELDVQNPRRLLAPGMYPEVSWPVRKGRASLLVPPTSIVTTTERSFVIRVNDGKAEWVNVRKGAPSGDLVEVLGPLRPGDRILLRGSDEIREGTPIGR
ncbi:MAG: efflux RND transporter periplasmic adaptor subunit [Bryobacteraceae bacterium]